LQFVSTIIQRAISVSRRIDIDHIALYQLRKNHIAKLIEEEAIASCQPSDKRILVFNATFNNISVIPSDDNYSNHNISVMKKDIFDS
jgi:hypothetical protein